MTQLESEIQQKLRQVGIAVVSPPAQGPFGTKNTLRVIITVTPSVPGVNQLSLHTRVILSTWLIAAGSQQRSELIIWAGKRSQVVSNADIETHLRREVDFLVDEFVAAYRSANEQS